MSCSLRSHHRSQWMWSLEKEACRPSNTPVTTGSKFTAGGSSGSASSRRSSTVIDPASLRAELIWSTPRPSGWENVAHSLSSWARQPEGGVIDHHADSKVAMSRSAVRIHETLPSGFRPASELSGAGVEVDFGAMGVVPVPVGPQFIGFDRLGLAERCAHLLHAHPNPKPTPIPHVPPLEGRWDRPVSRRFSLDEGFQHTYALLEVRSPAL